VRSYQAEREIGASAEEVWALLTDARQLALGTLGITKIEGTIAAGGRIKLWSEMTPGRAFPLRIGVFEPPSRMTWEGGMPLGLFKGVRTFTVTPMAQGVRFRMEEVFTGLLAPLILKSVPDLGESFERFASGLKALAEGRS